MTEVSPLTRSWTYAGLAIALCGAPAVVILFKLAGFTRADFGATVVRELIILALVAILFWIIRSLRKAAAFIDRPPASKNCPRAPLEPRSDADVRGWDRRLPGRFSAGWP